MATIRYNKNLKLLARQLRNNSTPAEIAIWLKLRRNQFMGYDFHRQKPIGNYIADFYCYDIKLIIEIDGKHHYEDDDTIMQDGKKEAYLKSIGFNILRFTNNQVLNEMSTVLLCLEQYAVDFEREYIEQRND